MSKRGRGRPVGSGESLTERLPLTRVSPADVALFRAAALATGVSDATWRREALRAAAKKVLTEAPESTHE